MCPTGVTSANPTPKSNLRTAFDVLDGDGDGRISYDDLRAFYNGVDDDDEMVSWMMSVADCNQDGYVEYDEFQKVLNHQQKQKQNNYKGEKARFGAGVMEDAFRVMDKDGDGVVGHQDLKSYLNSVGLEASDDDIKAMISLAGLPGNLQGQGEGVTLEALLNILSVV